MIPRANMESLAYLVASVRNPISFVSSGFCQCQEFEVLAFVVALLDCVLEDDVGVGATEGVSLEMKMEVPTLGDEFKSFLHFAYHLLPHPPSPSQMCILP